MMTCALLAGTLVLLAPVGVFAQAASPAETRLEMERRQVCEPGDGRQARGRDLCVREI